MELSVPKSFFNHADYLQITKAELCAPSPSGEPVFVFENGSSWVRLSQNVIFNGSSLALAYTIAAFCIRTISRSYIQLPSLPKVVVWLTLPLALYNDLYIVTGYLIHLATFPLLSEIIGLDLDAEREKLADISGSLVKRCPIEANGSLSDAVMI